MFSFLHVIFHFYSIFLTYYFSPVTRNDSVSSPSFRSSILSSLFLALLDRGPALELNRIYKSKGNLKVVNSGNNKSNRKISTHVFIYE